MLTRKHYKLLATCFNDTLKEMPNSEKVVGYIVGKLSYHFKQDNLLFNEEKWLKACLTIDKKPKAERIILSNKVKELTEQIEDKLLA